MLNKKEAQVLSLGELHTSYQYAQVFLVTKKGFQFYWNTNPVIEQVQSQIERQHVIGYLTGESRFITCYEKHIGRVHGKGLL